MDQSSRLLHLVLNSWLTQRRPYWGGQVTGSPLQWQLPACSLEQLLNVPCQVPAQPPALLGPL